MKKAGGFLIFLTCISIFSQEKELSFSTVEEIPIYKGCENFTTNETRKKCLTKMLNQHIQKEFNFEIVNCLEQKTIYNRKKGHQKKCVPVLLSGEKRVFLDFIINKEGAIVDINARAPHSKLEEEMIRVANLIPKMIAPGKDKGKTVQVSYTLPIDFTVK